MAVELQASLLAKVGPHSFDSLRVRMSPDVEAMVEQVGHDHGLIRARLARLGGPTAERRMDAAVEATTSHFQLLWHDQAAATAAGGST